MSLQAGPFRSQVKFFMSCDCDSLLKVNVARRRGQYQRSDLR
jgi:hypothetical protein